LGVLTCTPREYVIGTANTEWGAAGRSGVRVDIARQDSRRRARLGCARRHGAAHQVCMPQPADSHLWSECCRSRAGLCFGATPRVRSGALHSHDGCCRSSYTAAYTVEYTVGVNSALCRALCMHHSDCSKAVFERLLGLRKVASIAYDAHLYVVFLSCGHAVGRCFGMLAAQEARYC
jgi:hypothetical protein